VTNKRHTPRTRLNEFIDIYSSHTDTPIGTIVDISDQGIQITLDKPIRSQRSYHFYLQPGSHSANQQESLQAFNHWCHKTSPSFYDAGFSVTQWPNQLKKIYSEQTL